MIRKYVDGDIDTVMQIWLSTNIQAHSFISQDYWKSNFDMVKEMMPLAEIYVHEVDNTDHISKYTAFKWFYNKSYCGAAAAGIHDGYSGDAG